MCPTPDASIDQLNSMGNEPFPIVMLSGMLNKPKFHAAFNHSSMMNVYRPEARENIRSTSEGIPSFIIFILRMPGENETLVIIPLGMTNSYSIP